MQEEEAKRRSQVTQEEDDFRKALRLSEEEEARRKRDLESANTNALFDDNLNLWVWPGALLTLGRPTISTLSNPTCSRSRPTWDGPSRCSRSSRRIMWVRVGEGADFSPSTRK